MPVVRSGSSADPAPRAAHEHDVPRGELTLPITGMTCANCAATVERTLRKTPGVSEASVNFASERATVRFDPAAVAVEGLARAVERAGYGVILAADG